MNAVEIPSRFGFSITVISVLEMSHHFQLGKSGFRVISNDFEPKSDLNFKNLDLPKSEDEKTDFCFGSPSAN